METNIKLYYGDVRKAIATYVANRLNVKIDPSTVILQAQSPDSDAASWKPALVKAEVNFLIDVE